MGNPKNWKNVYRGTVDLGNVDSTDEVIGTVMMPVDSIMHYGYTTIEYSASHPGSRVWFGSGTKKSLMRDNLGCCVFAGPHSTSPFEINRKVDALHYAHVIALSAGATLDHHAGFMFESLYDILFCEQFCLDPADATVDWTVTTDTGCTCERSSTAIDSNCSLHVDTDADDENAYLVKLLPEFSFSNGKDTVMRAFIHVVDGSAVTTTTDSSTLSTNSPFLFGVRDDDVSNYGLYFRLRGTQAATDTFQLDLNYPTGGTIGLISGTTDLTVDTWYLAEAVISKGTPGTQAVALNTYEVSGTGVIGSAVSEGTATDGYLDDTLIDSTGKLGDADYDTGTSQIEFYVDQCVLYQKD